MVGLETNLLHALTCHEACSVLLFEQQMPRPSPGPLFNARTNKVWLTSLQLSRPHLGLKKLCSVNKCMSIVLHDGMRYLKSACSQIAVPKLLCQDLAGSQDSCDDTATVQLALAALLPVLQVLCEHIHMLRRHARA